MEQFILVNGRTIKNGVGENKFGQMAHSTKAIGKIILPMVKVD
jgi:hypothetical protein